jgi:hypothetical protein
MTRHGTQARRASFVIRVVRDKRDRISGVIERVATGAKEAFKGSEAIGPAIARMVESEGANPGLPARTRGHRGDAASPRRPGARGDAATAGRKSARNQVRSEPR